MQTYTHKHTHFPGYKEKTKSLNILLHPFILDAEKLYNFFSLECIKRIRKRKKYFYQLHIMWRTISGILLFVVGIQQPRTFMMKKAFIKFLQKQRYFALEHSVQSTSFFCLSDDYILKTNLSGLLQKIIKKIQEAIRQAVLILAP